MSDLVKRAREYLAMNAAESGTDVLIAELADEIERLDTVLEMKLPCEIAIAPATIIGKGCALSTVALSLQQRVKWGVEVGGITDAAKQRLSNGS